MLERLDDVNWAGLTHAYGSASDVPGLIRDLATPDPKRRDHALYELFGNIYHQGTVYEATSHAVPFLFELVDSESVADRNQIVILLASIANGTSYWDVHQHLEFPFIQQMRSDPKFAETLEKEALWVLAAHQAVVAGMDVLLSLLEHSDSELRTATAYVLACLPEVAEKTASHLVAVFGREADSKAKASQALSLGALGKPVGPIQSLLADGLKEAETPVVRLASAMALARLMHREASPEVIRTLLSAVREPDDYEDDYDLLPWRDGGTVADACRYLCLIGPEQAHFVTPLLIDVLQAIDAYGATSITYALLYFAFGGRPIQPDQLRHHLTVEQRQVLKTLADDDNAWRFLIDMQHTLRAFSLPDSRDGLQAFLSESGEAT